MPGEGLLFLLIGSVGILFVGWLLTPSGERQPASSEAEDPVGGSANDNHSTPNGHRAADPFRDLSEVGQNALQYCVAFPATESRPRALTSADFCVDPNDETPTAGVGLLVSGEGDVLTCVEALGGNREPVGILAGGTRLQGVVRAYEPETGLTLVRLTGHEGLPAAAIASVTPQPGELAVAAGHTDRDFVAPVSIAYRDNGRYGLGSGSGIPAPGVPVFNLAGEALGISTGAASQATAFGVREALVRLETLAAERGALPASLGVLLQALNPALESRFGHGGALISEVLHEGPAAAARFRPGDVIVRLAGRDVGDLAGCVRLISSLPVGERVEVVSRRGGSVESRWVQPVAVFDRSPAGRTLKLPSGAPTAARLFPRMSLAEAQVPEDVVVLMIENAAVPNALAAERLLRRYRPPWLVYLADERRRFFAVLARERRPRAAQSALGVSY